MDDLIDFEDFVERVTVRDFTTYLERRGWRRRASKRPEAILYEEPNSGGRTPAIALLPASETYADFPLRVEELLHQLSVLENRRVGRVAEEVLAIHEELERADASAAENANRA